MAVIDRPTAASTRPAAVLPFRADPALAVAMMVLFPLRSLAPAGNGTLTLGLLLAVAFLPVLLPAVRDVALGPWIVGTLTAALLSGPLLVVLSLQGAAGARSFSFTTFRGVCLILVSAAFFFVAVLWSRRHLTLRVLVTAVAAGGVLEGVLGSGAGAGGWKFAFAVPVTLGLLAWADGRTKWAATGVLVAVAGVSVVSDARNVLFSAILTLVVFWWPRGSTSPVRAVVGLVAVVGALYAVFLVLASGGYLGTAIEGRTVTQTRDSSLIAGARPEFGAAVELVADSPFGFGPGVAPSATDVSAAVTGLRSVNPTLGQSDYVSDYLFGSRVELHSVAADLWVNFGPVGLAAAGLFAVVLLRRLAREFVAPRRDPLLVFLVVTGLWDLLFSPIGTNLRVVVLGVALCAVVVDRRPPGAAPGGAPSRRISPCR